MWVEKTKVPHWNDLRPNYNSGFREFCCAPFLAHFVSLSPSFSLFIYSTIIFFVLLIHVNCSLDELQVNYNNDWSRWFNRFFLLNVIYLLTLYSSLLSLFFVSAGTSQTQICPQSRKANLHKYVLCEFFIIHFLLIFVNFILILFSSSVR